MTEGVYTVKEDALIGQVAHLMLRNKVSGYPVISETGVIIGIVTLTDLLHVIDQVYHHSQKGHGNKKMEDRKNMLYQQLGEWKDKSVVEVMTRNIVTVQPDMPVSDVLDIVVKWNIHSFPVVRDNELVGIVGRHDLLNATFVYC